MISRKLSVAPMLDWTDKYCLYFFRLLSQNTLFYTEMVTTGAIIFGDSERYLSYFPQQHPVALQLGGSEPKDLAQCAKLACEYGYDEINLNVGCPSKRVQRGAFGACLMAEPNLVADCVSAMAEACDVPITVKHRIGIDDQDSYEALQHFVETVSNAGCDTFIVHARKAWLSGLSPKENRDVPPLRYELVQQLKQDFPELNIVINGGIKSLEQIQQQLEILDGVMIGREFYHNSWLIAEADRVVYGDNEHAKTRLDVVKEMTAFIEEQADQGVAISKITRHMLGLFQGQPGARVWRRYISENVHKSPSTDILLRAVDAMNDAISPQ